MKMDFFCLRKNWTEREPIFEETIRQAIKRFCWSDRCLAKKAHTQTSRANLVSSGTTVDRKRQVTASNKKNWSGWRSLISKKSWHSIESDCVRKRRWFVQKRDDNFSVFYSMAQSKTRWSESNWCEFGRWEAHRSLISSPINRTHTLWKLLFDEQTTNTYDDHLNCWRSLHA